MLKSNVEARLERYQRV